MQLKLLNFHKMLSEFATNLVGAFVALIIYQATGSLLLTFAFLSGKYVIIASLTALLRKQLFSKPQLFLMFRMVTITGYCVFILLLDVNLVIGVIGTCLFQSLDAVFKALPQEAIFNYSSLSKGTGSLGFTRAIAKAGVILSVLIGGFLLDINQTIVIILTLVLYFISVIPLVMFYVKSRKEKTFNKDATSNARMEFEKNEDTKEKTNKVIKKLLYSYFIVYFLTCTVDVIPTYFKFHIFINNDGLYSMIGIYSALFNCASMVSNYLFAKLNDKKETTNLVVISAFIVGAIVIAMPFISNIYILGVMYVLFGFFAQFIFIFMLQRMLIKSRIMGCSNRALLYRDQGANISYLFSYAIGMTGIILPAFIIIGIIVFFGGLIEKINEERTRKMMVDFLQQNEIE